MELQEQRTGPRWVGNMMKEMCQTMSCARVPCCKNIHFEVNIRRIKELELQDLHGFRPKHRSFRAITEFLNGPAIPRNRIILILLG